MATTAIEPYHVVYRDCGGEDRDTVQAASHADAVDQLRLDGCVPLLTRRLSDGDEQIP